MTPPRLLLKGGSAQGPWPEVVGRLTRPPYLPFQTLCNGWPKPGSGGRRGGAGSRLGRAMGEVDSAKEEGLGRRACVGHPGAEGMGTGKGYPLPPRDPPSAPEMERTLPSASVDFAAATSTSGSTRPPLPGPSAPASPRRGKDCCIDGRGVGSDGRRGRGPRGLRPLKLQPLRAKIQRSSGIGRGGRELIQAPKPV